MVDINRDLEIAPTEVGAPAAVGAVSDRDGGIIEDRDREIAPTVNLAPGLRNARRDE